jgi:hypothetical protein
VSYAVLLRTYLESVCGPNGLGSTAFGFSLLLKYIFSLCVKRFDVDVNVILFFPAAF